MQLDWLLYFTEVLKVGTITAAAQNLHVSQPALSKTIKNLETELGQPLLKRTNHGVYPTAFGQKVFDDFSQIQKTMQSWYLQKPDEAEGQIHICCIACASNYVLNNIIKPFCQQYPKIDIALHDLRVQTVIHTLKNTPANLAITSLPYNNKISIQAEALNWPIYHLFTDERRLLIGATHPLAQKERLSLEDLKTLSLAYYSTEFDISSAIFAPYFASTYRVATRENIMELVIDNAAVFTPVFKLMKNDFYVTRHLVKSYPLPIENANFQVPIAMITTEKLSSCEILFRDALLQHFANVPI